MMKSKHYTWLGQYEGDGEGRIAVALVGGKLTVKQLAGKAPPPSILPIVLSEFLSDEELSEINNGFYCAVEPMNVEVRRGMSGCRDYVVRRLVDHDLLDAPTTARVHVSMHGKLNEGFAVRLSEVAGILDEMDACGDLDRPVVMVEEVAAPDPSAFGHRRVRLVRHEGALRVERNWGEPVLAQDDEDYLDEATLARTSKRKLRTRQYRHGCRLRSADLNLKPGEVFWLCCEKSGSGRISRTWVEESDVSPDTPAPCIGQNAACANADRAPWAHEMSHVSYPFNGMGGEVLAGPFASEQEAWAED